MLRGRRKSTTLPFRFLTQCTHGRITRHAPRTLSLFLNSELDLPPQSLTMHCSSRTKPPRATARSLKTSKSLGVPLGHPCSRGLFESACQGHTPGRRPLFITLFWKRLHAVKFRDNFVRLFNFASQSEFQRMKTETFTESGT